MASDVEFIGESAANLEGPKAPPKKGRPASAIWAYFLSEGNSINSQKRKDARCKYCDRKFPGAKTTDLETHISTGCGKIPAQERAAYHMTVRAELGASLNDCNKVPLPRTKRDQKRLRMLDDSKQGSIRSSFHTHKFEKNELKKCQRAQLLFFIMCNIP